MPLWTIDSSRGTGETVVIVEMNVNRRLVAACIPAGPAHCLVTDHNADLHRAKKRGRREGAKAAGREGAE